MNGYPRDMFDEMDEMFDHLFSRMQENRMTKNSYVSGFRVVFESPDSTVPRNDAPAIQPRDSPNPLAEVHQIDDEIKVIVELPGAAPGSIRLDLQGRTLVIDAGGIDPCYHTTADLPPVDAGSMQSSFRNGVLEVTLRILL
jgi:HSP20 family molecular chaperone IbpA